jgi:hypothetical protein
VERLRKALTADLIYLQSLQSNLSHTRYTGKSDINEQVDESFEESDDEAGEADPCGEDESLDSTDPDIGLPPEHVPLNLPSSQTTTPNAPYWPTELRL